MKTQTLAPAALTLLLCATACLASSRSASSYSLNDSTDAGGQHAASANYAVDSSIGGFGGISTAGSDTAKHGYVGQLTEVSSVSVTGTPAQVNECSATQLGGTAAMDDATVTVLAGSEIAWGAPAWPIQTISVSGVATTMAVYANTSATVSGLYLGISGSGSLLVLDSIPDNFGAYAGDGLPDSWQVRYFGLNNPQAVPAIDTFGTGQNNMFKYVAGLDPTNPASLFTLNIVPNAGMPNREDLVFSPCLADRTYTVLFTSNLLAGAFIPVNCCATNDDGARRTVTDLLATTPCRFYRVRISYP